MALLDLLFNVTQTEIGSVTVDATLSQEHTSAADVTDHPVEDGADVSDHVRVRAPRVRLTGVVSNTPLVASNFTGDDRAGATWQDLLGLQHTGALIDVVTSLDTYDNMVIEELSATRDAQRGDSLHFTAVLKRITKAVTQVVAAPAPDAPPAQLGKQATPEAPAPVRESVLSKLATWAGF